MFLGVICSVAGGVVEYAQPRKGLHCKDGWIDGRHIRSFQEAGGIETKGVSVVAFSFFFVSCDVESFMRVAGYLLAVQLRGE